MMDIIGIRLASIEIVVFLVNVFCLVHGSILKTDTIQSQCVVVIGNKEVLKAVNSTWRTSESPCLLHSCTVDDLGNPNEHVAEEKCPLISCKQEYELLKEPGKCCGTCFKTKCLSDGKIFKVGETWRNDDNCTIFECTISNGKADISTYRKYCPEIPKDCPKGDIIEKNCCPICRTEKKLDTIDHDIGGAIFDENFYRQHPCARTCVLGEPAMVCNYTFVVEWFETLSKACYDCPNNLTDCSRPHCIFGDGARRSVTVVNRMMPGPSIEVCLNDTILVDVKNHLLGESTTIHWHGLHQVQNPYMDGVPHISQCPIQPHATFRYLFKAANSGTHFWHSHTGMQRGDGNFGALIIRQPKILDPHAKLYDFDLYEHKMIVQDWAHTTGVSMFSSHHNSIGDNKPPNILVNGKGRYYPEIFRRAKLSENVVKLQKDRTITMQAQWASDSAVLELNHTEQGSDSHIGKIDNNFESPSNPRRTESDQNVNETSYVLHSTPTSNSKNSNPDTQINQDQVRNKRAIEEPHLFPLETFTVVPGFSYRFRVINAEFLNCPIAISIDNHTLVVISSDGYDLEPVEVTSLVTYAGERFDFVLQANQPNGNYWIRMKGLMDCDERFTAAFQAAILHYDGAPEMDEPSGTPKYDFSPGGTELNALNKGPGYVDSLTIAELNSLISDEEDDWLKDKKADHTFYIYYDFYAKDHPSFHASGLYGFDQTTNKSNRLFTPQLNHISLKMPSVPLMPARDQVDSSMFCNETTLAAKGVDCRKEFCECHHVLQVPLNSIVELVLVDEGVTFDANHPFHLHGGAFRVIGLERIGSMVTVEQVKLMDAAGLLKRNFNRPPIKDTVTVPDGGYTIVRFKASNPGYWLFHCHIEFHAEIGMALVLKVGEHDQMVPVPKNFPQCFDYKPGLEEADGPISPPSDDRSATYNLYSHCCYTLIVVGILALIVS